MTGMKGTGNMYFILLSIVGILIGIYMITQGLDGKSLGPTVVLVIGIFVVVKEILDIIH
jgi:hypothetical protein